MMNTMNLSNAEIYQLHELDSIEQKAITVLQEEVAKRSDLSLPLAARQLPAEQVPLILVGTREKLTEEMTFGSAVPWSDLKQLTEEGYLLQTSRVEDRPIVWILGADARGLLFGIGKLLRQAVMKQYSFTLTQELQLVTSPKSKIRGHQLGYRPKTNAYDAWTIEQYEQYIRDLALFGTNTIEILPPRTDDDSTGPLVKYDSLEMMITLSRIIASYGLSVWVWYPNMAEDYADSEVFTEELRERAEIFSKLERIDVVMIPGSDPGTMHPDELFPWSQEVANLLHRYHAEAEVWLAPQVMEFESRDWLASFYQHMDKEPSWIGGIVYGPHVDEILPKLREKISARYPICRYEDITHNYHCQYPTVEWDLAFALTIAREGCNPRPRDQKHIHNVFESYAIGNISYSEGINDDVNKFVWSDQDWDPNTPVIHTLREFARVFIGADYAEAVARGLLALEANWDGPLIINEQVDITLQQWMDMERTAPAHVLANYRFQMGLIRSYYDAYVKRRLIRETELEQVAKDALRFAPQTGSLVAIQKAEAAMISSREAVVALDYRERCVQLADALFENIGYQLTVERHHAISVDRGAFMDTIDAPLINYDWIMTQCSLMKELDDEQARLQAIHEMLNRTNPGPGGYYSNIGAYRQHQHMDPGLGWEQDPGYLESPRTAPGFYLFHLEEQRRRELGGIPLNTVKLINTMNDTPIKLNYDDLNPSLNYRVKLTFLGDIGTKRNSWVRITANESYVLEDDLWIESGTFSIKEFVIPAAVIAAGKLELTIQRVRGFKRLNVAEVWVIPEQ